MQFWISVQYKIRKFRAGKSALWFHSVCFVVGMDVNSKPRRANGVFPKWSRTSIEFNEFSKFRESEKSLKHDLGLIQLSSHLAVSLWHSGRISVSHTGNSGFEYSNLLKIILFLSLNSLNSVRTFRENSNIFCGISGYSSLKNPASVTGDSSFLC